MTVPLVGEHTVDWFFAFDEASTDWFQNMVKVAVLSARANTTLWPRCLYDGRPSDLTNWLQRQDVEVTFDEVPFKSELSSPVVLERHKGTGYAPAHAAGAFLRTNAARHARGSAFLYTDCDVIFLRDPVPHLEPATIHFACEHNSPAHFNSGVMLADRTFYLAQYDGLVGYLREHGFFKRETASYDQSLQNEFWRDRWQALPQILNWRPFCGINADAAIVHFHGPKPHRVQALIDGTASEAEAGLGAFIDRDRRAYAHYTGLFRDILAAA